MSTVITPKTVANNVRIWRMHLGFKQHVIADELGMSREWYIKLENGQVDLKIKHLLIIAQVLGVTLEEFFKEKVEFTKQKSAPPPEIEHNLDQVVEKKVVHLLSKLLDNINKNS